MKWINGGVPREFNFAGIDLTPTEGETLTYMLSGRGGPVHIGGNGRTYKESNPYLGGVNQSVLVSDDDMKTLTDAQGSGEEQTGYITTASGVTFNIFGGIANDGPLENNNGNVALEIRGNVEEQ